MNLPCCADSTIYNRLAFRKPLAWRSLVSHPMSKKKGPGDRRARKRPASEEELQGPPARETTVMRDDRERADHVGEEAVGGTVATPDQNVVDDLGSALGVPRAPDEEVRTSGEILEGRDRYRWEQETGGDA